MICFYRFWGWVTEHARDLVEASELWQWHNCLLLGLMVSVC